MSAISLHILIYSCLIKQSKLLREKLYRKSLCPHTSLHVNVGVVLFCCLFAFKSFYHICLLIVCVCGEIREQPLGARPLHRPCSAWCSNAGCQAQGQVYLPLSHLAGPLLPASFGKGLTLYPRLVLNQGKLSDSASQVLGLPAFMNYHTRGNLTSFPWLKQQAPVPLFEGSQTNVYFLFYLCWGVFCDLKCMNMIILGAIRFSQQRPTTYQDKIKCQYYTTVKCIQGKLLFICENSTWTQIL